MINDPAAERENHVDERPTVLVSVSVSFEVTTPDWSMSQVRSATLMPTRSSINPPEFIVNRPDFIVYK